MNELGQKALEYSRQHLWLVLTPVVFVLLMLIGAAWLFWMPNSFDGYERVVIIPRGTNFPAVVDSLESAGVLQNRRSFVYAARILDVGGSIQFGKYRFKSGMSNLALLRDLSEGLSNYPIPVLIGEGMRMRFIAAKFSREVGTDSAEFMDLCQNPVFIESLGIDAPTLEGYLLPDTYAFKWQKEEHEIISSLVGAFKNFYTDSLIARQEEVKMSLKQVLTLASIVEGETSVDSERATVAGVYLNRLRIRMPLQADPTIQYILPNGPRRLLYTDLQINSPYNTYRYYGLPPGPINNPGRKSILAVLYPEQHKYLYFVANGTGGHTFSKTYGEHQRAVRTWRRVRREIELNSSRVGG
ncbi:MAG: endolytic transglycosylase MltG [Ignavibacteriae bacterium]|nr:endolytic transglycosylase MltG [Ignavibacteriota bacterium]